MTRPTGPLSSVNGTPLAADLQSAAPFAGGTAERSAAMPGPGSPGHSLAGKAVAPLELGGLSASICCGGGCCMAHIILEKSMLHG